MFEVPLGTLSRLVLEARNVTSKLQSISTTRAASKVWYDAPKLLIIMCFHI